MSRTRVQQTQISGSLSSDILDNLAAGSELAAQSTLVGDLNAMRSQLNKIIGVGNWYDELAGTQDLADIQGAMHVTGADADFQGDVAAAGELRAINGNFVVETGDAGYAEDGYGAYHPALVGGLPLTEFHLDEGYGDKTAVFVPGASIFAWRSASRAMLYLTVSSSTFNVVSGRTEVTLTTPAGISMWSVGIVGNALPDGADHTISAGPTADTMTMTGEIKISGDVAQRLYIVGADGQISDEAGLSYDGSQLAITGNLSAVDGFFSGDLSAVDATLTGNLSAVDGNFSGNVTAISGSFSAVSISGDVAERLYIVGADGTIKDESKLTFDGSALAVDGDIKIADDAMNAGRLYMVGPNGEIASESKLAFVGQMTGWELNVDGSIVSDGQISAASGSFSGNLDAVDGTFSGNLAAVDATMSGDLSAVDGTFSGDLSAVSGSFSAVSISGDVAQRLYIVGADGEIKDESKLTFDGSELAIDGDLAAADGHFTGNVQVDGDLRVKGAMTYIDTQNMRVQDAFIYLATGSAGTTDSGIVLHGGAGANMDLVIGQDGGAGEVIFGKANRAPDGDGAMDGIELVPAWMSAVKLGGIEGAQSGSLNVAGNDVKLEAANDLVFRANGWELDLMSAADYTLFDTNFSATSIVGALNELYAAGAGGAAKGNLVLSDVTVDVLDFSAVGTLNSADHKFIDVYLNGVLLAPGIDVTAVAVDNVTLAAGVVSELAVDDVFTVVLRGAAAS